MIVSLAVYLGVGWYAGRRVKHLDDYYVAGRNAPTLLIVGTLVASFLSTNAFMGEVSMSYMGHAPLLIIMTGVNCVGYIVGALFFGRYLRRSQALTVPQFLGERFASRRLQRLAGLTIIVGLSGYLMAVTWGVALIVSQISGLPFYQAVLITWLGYTCFTLYSGSKGVILTDTIMFLLFVSVAVLACFFIVEAGGGWFTTVERLAVFQTKPELIAWHGYLGPGSSWNTPFDALIWALILGIAWGFVVAVSPWQASRYLMAKSEHVVIRSACGASLAVAILYLATSFGAAAVNLSNSQIDPPESTMIWVATNLMPNALGAILVAGILAAGLSSASTFLSLVGFSASTDVFQSNRTPEQQLRFTRVVMIIVSLLVLLLALVVPSNIFWITYFAGPLFASCWGAVAFMSVWSKRITASGAFWGMVAGFVGNIATNLVSLVLKVDLPVYMDPILVGGLSSLITIMLVSRTGQVSPSEHAYRQNLHSTPADEHNLSEIRQTMMWPKILIGGGIVLMIAITWFYALPYQRAVTSALTTSGSP